MTEASEQRMAVLLHALQQDPSLPARLPNWEAEIVNAALAGQSIYTIAQEQQMAEAAIWEVLGNAARAATGVALHPVETGGLGSDTDPGIGGGYDETGFGRLPSDAPLTALEERDDD